MTQRIYRAPTPSVPHWLLFNPTEIDMLGIPAPPGFFPSPPFEEAMFNGITGQPFEEATLNGMDEVIQAVSQVIDHRVPAPTSSQPGIPRNTAVAEKMVNFLKSSRTTLVRAGLPAGFWPYAVQHYGWTLNRG